MFESQSIHNYPHDRRYQLFVGLRSISAAAKLYRHRA